MRICLFPLLFAAFSVGYCPAEDSPSATQARIQTSAVSLQNAISAGDASSINRQASEIQAYLQDALRPGLNADPDAAGLLNLASRITGHISASQASVLAGNLKTYLSTPAGAQAISGVADSQVVLPLLNLLASQNHQTQASQAGARWLSSRTTLPELDLASVEQFTRLLNVLVPERHQAIWTLAASLHRQHLGTPENLKKIGLPRLIQVLGSLSPDMDIETKADWSARLRLAFLPDEKVVAQIDPVTMDPLAKLLFDLNLDQGRQVLSDWFKKPEHWKIPDPAVAIRLAGLGTYREPFSVLSLEELPLTATGMLVIADALDPKTLDPAFVLDAMDVLWKGGQPLRAREWAPIVIDRCCAQVSLLPRLARILHQIGFSGPKKSYPQILAATVKAIENGQLPVNAEDDQALALVLCDPASRLELERILLGPDSLPRPRVAALLAWATRDAGAFDPWAQRVKSKVTADADATDAKAAWLIAECYVDEQMLRPGMEAPGKVNDASIRRFRALKLALIAAKSDTWKTAVLREIAAYFISRYRGKQGADLLANFESQSPALVAELKQSLMEYDRQRLINEEREILANKRSGEMVLLERQRRDLVTVSKTGDTAVITRLKNHILELDRSTRPAMMYAPESSLKGSPR